MSKFAKPIHQLPIMVFLKLFFPEKSFLNCSSLILHVKILPQTNFYIVSQFSEHLQHFSDIVGFLNKFDSSDFSYVFTITIV